MSQEKISAAKAAAVYSEVPSVLRSLASERDGLLEKNAALQAKVDEYEKHGRIEKIAQAMEVKGISPDMSREDRIEQIKEAASQGKSLDVIEEAIEMTAPNGELGKLGSVGGNGEDALTSYLVGGLSD
jgi:hypothetical protein